MADRLFDANNFVAPNGQGGYDVYVDGAHYTAANQVAAESLYNTLTGGGGGNTTNNNTTAAAGSKAQTIAGASAFLPSAVSAAEAAAQQQYLRDRLAQLELPQARALMTGYYNLPGTGGANMSENDALDFIWKSGKIDPGLYTRNGWKAGTPDEQRAIVKDWIGGADPANKGKTPQQIAAELGAPTGTGTNAPGGLGTPTFERQQWEAAASGYLSPGQATLAREQWQSSDALARRAQALAEANVSGYMPGAYAGPAGPSGPGEAYPGWPGGGAGTLPGQEPTGPVGQPVRDPQTAALDYIWRNRTDLADFYRVQGAPMDTPAQQRALVLDWLKWSPEGKSVGGNPATNTPGDPLALAGQMGMPTAFPGGFGGANTLPVREGNGVGTGGLGNSGPVFGGIAGQGTLPAGGTTAANGINGRIISQAPMLPLDQGVVYGRPTATTAGGRETPGGPLAMTQGGEPTGRLPVQTNAAPNYWASAQGAPAQSGYGAPTLARQQWESANAQNVAGLTGMYGGQQTLAGQQFTAGEAARQFQQELATRQQAQAEAARQAELLGTYNGQQTLAGLQAERQYGLGTRAQTLAEQQAAQQYGLQQAGVTGTYNGQQTLGAQQQQFAQAMAGKTFNSAEEARLFGQQLSERQFGASEAARQFGEQMAQNQYALQTAGVTGTLNGQETLAARQAREANDLARQRFGSDEAARLFSEGLANRQFTSAEEARLFGQDLAQRQFGSTEAARLFGQQMAAQQFAAQEAGRSAQERMQLAGITGTINGQQTLAAQTLAEQQAARRAQEALQAAGLTGVYGGQQTLGARQQTLSEQQAAQQYGLAQGGLTGTYNGQQTLAAQSLAEQRAAQRAQEALQAAGLTGVYGGQQTLGARQQTLAEEQAAQQYGLAQGGLLGTYNGQQTLAARAQDMQNQQFYADLARQMSGPRDWGRYLASQPSGAFGEVKGTPSWEQATGNPLAAAPNYWTAAQGANGNPVQAAVLQPQSIKPNQYANMSDAKKQAQEGLWSAQGVVPQDAWKQMQSSWATNDAQKRAIWR